MELFPYFERVAVAEKTMSSNLDRINKSDMIGSRDPVIDTDKQKREHPHEQREKENDEAGEHFESLRETAGLVNGELEAKKSPYRFYIYREYEDIFINLVRLDQNGRIAEVKKKNITHREFNDLITRIHQGEGLLFDSIG